MFDIFLKTEQTSSVLQLQGRFDHSARKTFFSAIKKAEEAQPEQIILDLSGVRFIDSAPIGWIVSVFHRLRRQSQAVQLILAGQQGWIDESLKSINLERLIPTVGSVEEALVVPPSQNSSGQSSLS